jgi:hypothetical protein
LNENSNLFRYILHFIYTDSITLDVLTSYAKDILPLANKLRLNRLLHICDYALACLGQNKAIIPNNFPDSTLSAEFKQFLFNSELSDIKLKTSSEEEPKLICAHKLFLSRAEYFR